MMRLKRLLVPDAHRADAEPARVPLMLPHNAVHHPQRLYSPAYTPRSSPPGGSPHTHETW